MPSPPEVLHQLVELIEAWGVDHETGSFSPVSPSRFVTTIDPHRLPVERITPRGLGNGEHSREMAQVVLDRLRLDGAKTVRTIQRLHS